MTPGSTTMPKWLLIALAAAVAIVIGGAASFFLLTIPVTAGGQKMRVLVWKSAGEVAAKAGLSAPAGDLRAVRDRRILKAGGGSPSYLVVNDRPAEQNTRLKAGDRIAQHKGADSVEATVVRSKVVPELVTVTGSGPIESVVQTGSAGLVRLTMGVTSGDVVKRVTVREATPTVVTRRQPVSGKVVALTFDDGPHPTQTPAVLAILKAAGIKATFFMVGDMARFHPVAAKDVAQAGMLIGNHSETHGDMPKMSDARVDKELASAQNDILRSSGYEPHWFRSPYGATTTRVRQHAERMGLNVVGWDVDANDWKRPPAKAISTYIIAHVRPGSIVLMHDGGGDRSHTIAALPVIIQALKKQGYRFVTLDQL